MLGRLTVSNLAIVEKADAEFAPGLNVLTGETGAGKSVLMGALELLAGTRADSLVVRDGAREARLEAEFVLSGASGKAVRAILEDVGIEAEGDVLAVRRTVFASGGGKVWVNDCASTVATLRRLAKVLVDIHGPRANQSILEERFQREALDSFGEVDRSAYDCAWQALCEARAQLERAEGATISADEADMLRYQVDELEAAKITAEDDDIARRHAAAAHAEEIVVAANSIVEAIGGDEGAAEALIRLRPLMSAAARHFPAAESWAEEADEITLRLQELSRTVADAASQIDADPQALAALDERLAVLNRLKRKYLGPDGGDSAALMAALERKRARLADFDGRESRIAELRERVAESERAVLRAGEEMGRRRAKASVRLARAVTSELRDLGFLRAKFGVRLERCAPQPHGCDRVAYEFEPNPGEAARALADIASSGEAARVMLALKGVLTAHDSTDVLVFDEIDANIGGETGKVVGMKMRALARSHQVIAITHLPQSAASADRHMVVAKAVSGGRTRTSIAAVEGAARVREIARMLGGADGSGVVMRHAEALLCECNGDKE